MSGAPTPPVPTDEPSRRAAITTTVTTSVRRARAVGTDRLADLEARFWPVAVGHVFYDRFRAVNGVVLAGHLAFRAFTFLLPLMFVFVAVAGVLHATGQDPAEASNQLNLGEAVARSLRSAGDEAGDAPFQVASAAAVGIVLGALGMFSGLHFVFAQAWQIRVRRIEGKVSKVARFLVAFTLLLAILILAGSLRHRGFVIGAASVVFTAALMAVLFVGLALIMPHRSDGLIWFVPGAVVGAAGMVALQAFATFYLPGKIEKFSATYGALGVAAVVISYLYFIGLIVVATAIANAVWFDFWTGRSASDTAQGTTGTGAVDEGT